MTRFVTSMRTPLTCCSQCADTPFPTLRTDPGPQTAVAQVYVSCYRQHNRPSLPLSAFQPRRSHWHSRKVDNRCHIIHGDHTGFRHMYTSLPSRQLIHFLESSRRHAIS